MVVGAGAGQQGSQGGKEQEVAHRAVAEGRDGRGAGLGRLRPGWVLEAELAHNWTNGDELRAPHFVGRLFTRCCSPAGDPAARGPSAAAVHASRHAATAWRICIQLQCRADSAWLASRAGGPQCMAPSLRGSLVLAAGANYLVLMKASGAQDSMQPH